MESLLKPENKDKLVKILTYHVVSADAMADAIKKMIKDDGGKHTITAVSGGKLVAMMKGDKIVLQDENGWRGDGYHRQREAVQRRDSCRRSRLVAEIK